MRNKILILFFFTIIRVNGQTTECEIYQKSGYYQNEKKLDSAIIVLTKMMGKFPDTSFCYRRGFNNIPYLYLLNNDESNAKKWLKKILKSTLDDAEETNNLFEPYANYKHRACLTLASIYNAKKQYKKGFEYIMLSESKYPYETFSAASFEKESVKTAFIKAQVKNAQNDKKSTLYYLIHKSLDNDIFFRKMDFASFTQIDFYSQLIDESVLLIDEIYGFEEFQKKFNESISKLKTESVFKGKEKTEMTVAIFTFDGKEYRIGSSKKTSKKEFEDILNSNQLFLTVSQKIKDKQN